MTRFSRPARRLMAALVVALAAAGCFGDDRPVVEVAPVRAGSVSELTAAPAQVEAAARQDVAAAVSGSVAAIEVDDGDTVADGDVIVRLDSEQVDATEQQAEVARAAADAGGAPAVDSGAPATRAATDEIVAELDATVRPELAEARAHAATLDDARQRAAVTAAIDAIDSAYSATRTAVRTSGSAVAAQQDALASSLSAAFNDAIRQATAGQRAQAEAAAEAAARQAEALELVAPLSGVVQLGEAAATDGVPLEGFDGLGLDGAGGLAGALGGLPSEGGSTLRVGAPVAPGQTLFTVFDLSSVYVTADVDEIDAPDVASGQRAQVLVDAVADTPLDGVVETVAVAAAPTGTGGIGYPTRIRLLAEDDEQTAAVDRLRVGMTASVDIVTDTVEGETVVPARALVRRGDDTVVRLVREGRIVEVDVDVLALGEDRAAVAGELARNNRVVVAGGEDVVDGQAVATRPADDGTSR